MTISGSDGINKDLEEDVDTVPLKISKANEINRTNYTILIGCNYDISEDGMNIKPKVQKMFSCKHGAVFQ
ncbi:23227_t:CDS:2 [Gigaspora rosea]|nr:23227_t:CDS:2 [Gigaspora rosea]